MSAYVYIKARLKDKTDGDVVFFGFTFGKSEEEASLLIKEKYPNADVVEIVTTDNFKDCGKLDPVVLADLYNKSEYDTIQYIKNNTISSAHVMSNLLIDANMYYIEGVKDSEKDVRAVFPTEEDYKDALAFLVSEFGVSFDKDGEAYVLNEADSEIQKELGEAISFIDEQIETLQQQKDMLNTINLNKKIDEDTWHRLMETDIRSSNHIVERLVKNIYPDAENFKLRCNYAMFDLQGIRCGISTSRCREILIVEDKKDKGQTFIGLNDSEIENLKEVISRLQEFSTNVNFYHWYRANNCRLEQQNINVTRMMNIIEQNKAREDDMER